MIERKNREGIGKGVKDASKKYKYKYKKTYIQKDDLGVWCKVILQKDQLGVKGALTKGWMGGVRYSYKWMNGGWKVLLQKDEWGV